MTTFKTELEYDTTSECFNMPDGTNFYYSGHVTPVTTDPATSQSTRSDEILKLKAAGYTFPQIKEMKEMGLL